MTRSIYSSTYRVRSIPLSHRLNQLLPLVGVLVLFSLWWLISISGLVNPVLLPTPWKTIAALFQAMFAGTMAIDFGALSVNSRLASTSDRLT